MAHEVERFKVPAFAAEHTAAFPEIAPVDQLLALTFYCINCRRKAECTYITGNVGPFCDKCLNEIKSAFALPGVKQLRHEAHIVVMNGGWGNQRLLNFASHLRDELDTVLKGKP